MSDVSCLLTPDEWLWADNQIKLLKMELEHNVPLELINEEMPSDPTNDYLDRILAFEAMQKNLQPTPVYELIGRPAFRPETDLSDPEVKQALELLLLRLNRFGLFLEILSPRDYDPRTIYRFVTNELFAYELQDFDKTEKKTFVYEEFYPNDRYTLTKQGERFVNALVRADFTLLTDCLEDQFLERQHFPEYTISLRPEVHNRLNELVESWWPRTLRSGCVTSVQITDEGDSAQLTFMLLLRSENEAQPVIEKGTLLLNRWDFWWQIERVEIGSWSLA